MNKIQNMNKKQVIRINEYQLKQIVTESVKRLLKEQIDLNPQNFVIVDAWNPTYNELIEDYADALISTNYGNYFIIPRKEVLNLKQMGNCSAYKIPTFCKTLDDVEEGLMSGVLDPQEEENSPLVRIF